MSEEVKNIFVSKWTIKKKWNTYELQKAKLCCHWSGCVSFVAANKYGHKDKLKVFNSLKNFQNANIILNFRFCAKQTNNISSWDPELGFV